MSMEFVLRFIIAAVLGLAATGKATTLRRFAKVIRQFSLASTDAVAMWLAITVTATEFTLAVCLVTGAFVAAAAWAAAAMFALFGLVLALVLRRGDTGPISCGCFGGNAPISWAHVVRNIVLSALAIGAAEPQIRGTAVLTACALLIAATAMRSRTVAATT